MVNTLHTMTASPGETARLAARVGSLLSAGGLIVIRGPIGAGKTVFARGLARGLGLRRAVRSPSFVVVVAHRLPGSRPIERLYQADLYRLRRIELDDAQALLEAIGDRRAITVIEWPERWPRLWRKADLRVAMTIVGVNRRRIALSGRLVGRIRRGLAERRPSRRPLRARRPRPSADHRG